VWAIAHGDGIANPPLSTREFGAIAHTTDAKAIESTEIARGAVGYRVVVTVAVARVARIGGALVVVVAHDTGAEPDAEAPAALAGVVAVVTRRTVDLVWIRARPVGGVAVVDGALVAVVARD